MARRELQQQCDTERSELMSNFERRNRYMKRVLQDCETTINMLKVNLDSQKEENFMLKVKMADMQRASLVPSLVPDRDRFDSGHFDILTNDDRDEEEDEDDLRGNSSIEGLKYSDVSNHARSPSPASSTVCTESYTSRDELHRLDNEDLHRTCREEFEQLLVELRNQKAKYEDMLQKERDKMRKQVEDEKLQFEKVVYKQLNLRIEKELQRRKFLVTENEYLRTTLSQATIDRYESSSNETVRDGSVTTCDGSVSADSNSSPERWKESNSDSGADVDDYERTTFDTDSLQYDHAHVFDQHCHICGVTPSKVKLKLDQALQQQKLKLKSDFQKQLLREKKKHKQALADLNTEIVALVKENRLLKEARVTDDSYIDDVNIFHQEIKDKLSTLENVLGKDYSGC